MMNVRVVCCVLVVCVSACSDSKSGSAPAENNLVGDCFQCPDDSGTGADSHSDVQGDSSEPVDTAGNNGTEPDVPTDGSAVDASEDEPFVRPDLGGEDATMDVPDTRPEPVEVTGFHECFEWKLQVDQTVFTVKEDNIFVRYEIHNTCGVPVRVRTMHESDFFAVGLQKNGEPWIFLPDCPGTGDPEEQTFGLGDGWARGYLWSPADFDARLERCGVVFEADAEYSFVGYGLEPVPTNDPGAWSEIFPMTDEIPIRLQR